MIAKRGMVLTLVPAAIATAILVIVSPWISGDNPTVRRLIMVSAALIIPSLLLSIVRAVAAAQNRWTAITVERIITAATKLIPLTVLFSIGELGLVAAAIVTITSTLTGAIIYIPLLTTQPPAATLEVVTNRQVLRFGAGIWVGTISGILLMRIDQVLMSPLAGAFELGLYAVAVSISELPLMVNSALRETAFTHLSDRGVRPAEVGDLSRVSTIIVLILCLAVGVVSPILVPLLFGRDFSASIPVLFILLTAVCLGNPGSLAGVALSSSGHPHLRSSALLVACVVNIALVLLLAPRFGAMGAATATLVGNLISSNIGIAWSIKKCGTSIGDFYRFRPGDFAMIKQLLSRGLRGLVRQVRVR